MCREKKPFGGNFGCDKFSLRAKKKVVCSILGLVFIVRDKKRGVLMSKKNFYSVIFWSTEGISTANAVVNFQNV